MAICLTPRRSVKAVIQLWKHAWKADGLIRAKTRRRVSFEGIPSGSSRKVCNHSALVRPYRAMSPHVLQPQITPQMTRPMMSRRECRRQRDRRGSVKWAKWWTRDREVAVVGDMFGSRRRAKSGRIIRCPLVPDKGRTKNTSAENDFALGNRLLRYRTL